MKQSYQIRGMYCPNCEKRIMTALGKMDGVKAVRVDYASGRAEIESKKPLDREQLQSALQDLGYELSAGSNELTRAASLLVIILGLTVILDRVGLLNRLVPRQLGTSGMSYGLFFVTGLLTSVHCVAMCGGINLSQSLPGRGKWSALLYNAGRVASYTLIGALLGAAGIFWAAAPLRYRRFCRARSSCWPEPSCCSPGSICWGCFPPCAGCACLCPDCVGAAACPL